MDLNEAIELTLKDFQTLKDDIKTNPKAIFSLVGPIRKLVPTIDPKTIKSTLETLLNTKIPEKVKEIEIKSDIWINKKTKERICRAPMSTTDNLTKIRSMEFYYVEGYTNTAYVNDKETFLNTFEKDNLDIPFKNCKWIDKTTKVEIDCIEKVDNNYLYRLYNGMKIFKMQCNDFLNQYERIDI